MNFETQPCRHCVSTRSREFSAQWSSELFLSHLLTWGWTYSATFVLLWPRLCVRGSSVVSVSAQRCLRWNTSSSFTRLTPTCGTKNIHSSQSVSEQPLPDFSVCWVVSGTVVCDWETEGMWHLVSYKHLYHVTLKNKCLFAAIPKLLIRRLKLKCLKELIGINVIIISKMAFLIYCFFLVGGGIRIDWKTL